MMHHSQENRRSVLAQGPPKTNQDSPLVCQSHSKLLFVPHVTSRWCLSFNYLTWEDF